MSEKKSFVVAVLLLFWSGRADAIHTVVCCPHIHCVPEGVCGTEKAVRHNCSGLRVGIAHVRYG